MGTYLHRITKEYLQSVSPNDLPEPLANYIDGPDLSSVVGVPIMFWIITGDVVTEMSQGEKDAVIAANLSLARDAKVQAEVDELESILRQLVVLMIGEINILRQQFNVTTGESSQLTDTVFTNRTLAQIKAQIRGALGS